MMNEKQVKTAAPEAEIEKANRYDLGLEPLNPKAIVSDDELLERAMAEAVQTACNNVFTFRIRMGNPSYYRQLPKELKEIILNNSAAKGLPPDEKAALAKVLNVGIPMFGAHQQLFKDSIRKPRGVLRNWGYTFPKDGEDKIATLDQMEEVYSKVGPELVQPCVDGLDFFCMNYREHCEAGIRHADEMFAEYGIQLSKWKGGKFLRFPSVEEFRKEFYVEITEPGTLDDGAVDRFGSHMPADLFLKMQASKVSKLNRALLNAKASLIDQAEKLFERLAHVTGDGERKARDTLIESARQMADRLESFAMGFDKCPWVLEAVKILREQVTAKGVADTWKENDRAKRDAHNAFSGVMGKLRSVVESDAAASEKLTVDKLVGNGLMGDLL